MTIQVPDFSNFTPLQFFIVLVIVAAIDFVTGVISALRGHTFSWDAVLTVLYTHGVQRVLPIAGLYGVGVIGTTPGLCLLADGLLAGYFVETFLSAQTNLTTRQVVPPIVPAQPVVIPPPV